MTSRARASFGPLLGAAGVAVFAACSTSGPPLGGPHGGEAFSLAPTLANSAEVDAAYTVPVPAVAPGEAPGVPGTWTHIYYAYLDKGTIGNCYACHKEMSTPTKAYQWLEDDGYVGMGGQSLTQTGASCLSWFGGDMPLVAPKPAQTKEAVDEMNMWMTAGGHNN